MTLQTKLRADKTYTRSKYTGMGENQPKFRQDRRIQKCMFDLFIGAVQPEDSCQRQVINFVGISRDKSSCHDLEGSAAKS